MKSDRPKQFIELKGKAIVMRTIECFLAYNPAISIVICVHRNYRSYLEGLLEKAGLAAPQVRVTEGGDTRFESVRNGLRAIAAEQGVVGIHDAARPLVSLQTIRNCFETAALRGNAVPCVPVTESLRKISNNVNASVNRNEFKIVQTPQCFHLPRIRKAFEQAYGSSFTDDASVLEASGESIILVEGNEENIKITSPHDLLLAQALIP
jgi:2-C-methyl-D-erythritol 4-phosphate cytidylyltransferase